ncbi:MAG: hypothetical protein H6828_07180 [Planctomycetes bacterium]|nr:hypothetical protein [Planctomycetota bacterium]
MDYSEDVWLDFIGRLHPILVHAPLGLLVALVAFELWGMLRKSAAPNQGQRRFLAFVLFASAFAAAFAGWRLEEENGYTWEGFWNHKYVALTFLGLCGCAWIAALAAWRSAYGWALFLALCVGGAAGHLGGALTHGDDYLFEPFHPREASQPAGTPATSDPAPAKDVTSEVVAPPAPPPTWYAARIAPIFAAYCVGCHGPDKQKGDLALHTGALVLAGTEHGRVVEPGDAENSLLFELVSLPLDEDDHMPPPKKPQPSAAEVAELGRWIAAGASLDAPLPAGDVAPVREVEAPPSAGDAPTNDAPPAPAEQAQAAPALDPALLAPLLAEQVHAECLDPAADLWWLDYRPRAATDDAYVERTLAPLAPHVVELSLARTQVAGACLALVATLPHLERLDLAQTRCGAALDALRDHPVLRSLNLAGVALDAGAVDVLASLPALERVYLWNTGLGEQDLALLKERRPALRVDSGEVHTAAQDG